tara:strand:+ start:49 stop:312 length:264 start_codon:yes stop_codon:yes gene_type:complete
MATDKKEDKLYTVGSFKEVADKLFDEDSAEAKSNTQYYKTNITKGKKASDIPTSGFVKPLAAVEGSDQKSLYTTMFGHIFRKYRTLV